MLAASLITAGSLLAPANPVLLYVRLNDPRTGSELSTHSSAGRHTLNINQPSTAGALSGAVRPDGGLIAFISGTTLWTAPLEKRVVGTAFRRTGKVLRAEVERQRDGTWTGAVRVAENVSSPLSWSADGRSILFNRPSRSTSGFGTIYRVSVSPTGAGTAEQRVLVGDGTDRDFWAKYSPNGSQILFTRYVSSRGDRLIKMNANGTSQTELPADNGIWNYGAWSSDGSMIAAVRTITAITPGTPGIYTMDSAGEGVRLISGTDSSDSFPMFSPDRKEVFFARQLNRGPAEHRDIYRAALDGRTAPRPLFTTPGISEIPLQYINIRM